MNRQERQTDRQPDTDRDGVSKLVFYAQSTSAVISERRETQRDRNRDRETEANRQRDRQTERKTETDRDRQTDRKTERENHFEDDEFSFTGPFRQWVSCPCRPLNRTRTQTVRVCLLHLVPRMSQS